MAKTGQSGSGWRRSSPLCRPTTQGAAPGAPVESAVLRRYRYADRRDGTWFYQKTPIGRPALVKLFASVLKREGDKYFLVTPVEKVGIAVADVPFLAVELDVGQGPAAASSSFRTNVDDWVACGPEHALRFEPEPGNRRPEALSACAPRPLGEGDAGAVLRPGGARRGARDRRPDDVRRRLRRQRSSPWRKQASCGSLPDGRTRRQSLRGGILRARQSAAQFAGAGRPHRSKRHARARRP